MKKRGTGRPGLKKTLMKSRREPTDAEAGFHLRSLKGKELLALLLALSVTAGAASMAAAEPAVGEDALSADGGDAAETVPQTGEVPQTGTVPRTGEVPLSPEEEAALTAVPAGDGGESGGSAAAAESADSTATAADAGSTVSTEADGGTAANDETAAGNAGTAVLTGWTPADEEEAAWAFDPGAALREAISFPLSGAVPSLPGVDAESGSEPTDDTGATATGETGTAEDAASDESGTGASGGGTAENSDTGENLTAQLGDSEDPWAPPDSGAAGVQDDRSWAAGPDAVPDQPQENLSERDLRDERKLERLVEQVTAAPETMERLEFTSVESLARARNLTVLGLEENIAALESLDYEDMADTLRKSLNAMARGQDQMQTAAAALSRSEPLAAIAASSSITSLQSTYNSLYQQFESIWNGDMQRSNRDVVRQLTNAADQVVMGTETLYIALTAMETQRGSLERQLAALDRTVEEMELRYDLGQISQLNLGEVITGRASLKSGLDTLEMNLRTYKMQLENMLGASPTGELSLGTLPAVSEYQIAGMDVERDLAAAQERSYELYAAARTLQDRQDAYFTSASAGHYDENNATYQQAAHTWQADQDTYNATVRSFELRFRTLYEQVRDYYQVWNAAKTALAQQERSWEASRLKYRQGNLSQNALLTAQDDLEAAREKVQTAANDLFSSYNNYCWAVQRGILN